MLKRKIFIKDKNFEVLPTSNTTANGSFAYLLQQYGVDSKLEGTGTSGLTYNIATSPLFFVRSGNIHDDSGWNSTDSSKGVNLAGSNAYGIGKSASSANYYRFIRIDAAVNNIGWYRHWGIPLRCLYIN